MEGVMSPGFRSDFDSRYVGQRDGRPVFRLLAPLIFDSAVAGRQITVPIGFETDLASVPRWVGTYLLAGGKAVRAAVVHDYLYERDRVTRQEADAVFLEAMDIEQDPEEAWRRWAMWAAVRAFGWAPFNRYRNPGPAAKEPPEPPFDPSPGA
jgi:hypothetical protein